jgi:hypothetical protein
MSASFWNAPPNKVSETRYKVKELDTVLVIDKKIVFNPNKSYPIIG